MSLVERKNWDFYQLDEKNPATHDITAGCGRVKRPAASHIEGLRLSNAAGDRAVVEVNINGTWGGICDDSFGINEANVVCKQMGFHLGARAFHGKLGRNPDDPIHLYGLECTGDEESLSQCHLSIHSDNLCSGVEKAGVE